MVDTSKIKNYEDLTKAKHSLREELREKESNLKSHNIFKVVEGLFNRKAHFKQVLSEGIPSQGIKQFMSSPLGNIVATFLLTNKVTRKLFIPVAIGSQIFPLVMEKVDELINTSKSNAKKR